jgi:protein-L-isoaspartate(D-aspartate) O-methyltransferase
MSDLAAARRRYADNLRERVGVQSAALVHAFATVPREHYLGPGPWDIFDLSAATVNLRPYHATPDADPVHLYRDVLVGIDATRGLNNGQPSAHALWMDQLGLQAGEHVVHVGCGTGYYAAILAEVVGVGGHVTAIELDPELAARARKNLAHLAHVEVVAANGCEYDPGFVDAFYVNAGATHPLPRWLDRLRPAGRLMLPLVRWPANQAEASASGMGVLLKVTRQGETFAARIVSLVGIFPCIGAVDTEADRRLGEALARGAGTDVVHSLRREPHTAEASCWLHGDGYCLSALPA